MSEEALRRYWDTSCFLAILNNEDRADDCRRILNEAADGSITLVTSFWTMTEAIRPRDSNGPLERYKEEEIRDFFENDYIVLRNVDRNVAEKARELCWQFERVVYACDAVHLATAILSDCPLVEAINGPLEDLDGRVGTPPLTIRKPKWTGQLDALEDIGDSEGGGQV